MPNPTLATLGAEVKKKRGNKTLRVAAKEIKISAATLMRVEAGRTPDVGTFGKICHWLGVDPGSYLGFPTSSPQTGPTILTVSAHLKADSTPKLPTVQALAVMIMKAVGRQKPTVTNGDT